MDSTARLKRVRAALEIIEDDPTPAQICKLIWDILNILEDKHGMGFTHEETNNNGR